MRREVILNSTRTYMKIIAIIGNIQKFFACTKNVLNVPKFEPSTAPLFTVVEIMLVINEIKDSNSKQYRLSEQLIETISNNANDVATAVKTGIKEIDLQQAEKGKLKTSAFKCKERISHLWNNTLNSRRQAFWQYYRSKQISEVYKKLLEKNPARTHGLLKMNQKKKRKSEHNLM